MPTFVLEIGCEEIPAGFLPTGEANLAELLKTALEGADLNFDALNTYSTPRRFAAVVTGLETHQKIKEQLFTGPAWRVAFDQEGKPTGALKGFARSQGVEIEDIFAHETPKGVYAATRKKIGGKGASEILPSICLSILKSLSFPKKMRWEETDFVFARPVRWILALLDAETITFNIAGIDSANLTYGHRVMGQGPFEVQRADDYFNILRNNGFVIPDRQERRESILKSAAELAIKHDARLIPNDSLLDLVVGLVEYPRPVLGYFDPVYLQLPREVLLTSMETHQKSFGLEDNDGDLKPYFLTVVNLEPRNEDTVRKGWQRVLKARLEDARFFFAADTKSSFSDWLDKLRNVVFIGPLGSMYDKAERLAALSGKIAEAVAGDLAGDIERAGLLAKADLVSEMVGEFDTLQGIMGGIYARSKGETENVASAIYEQYLPAGPETPVPSTLPGAILALADKFDNLVSCFGLNMIPTGAADPYALRRQTLGIVRIILEHDLTLDLAGIIEFAQESFKNVKWKISPVEAREKLIDFIGARLKVFFQSKGYDTLVIEACISAGFTDVRLLSKRLAALSEFSKSADFERAVLTFKRAANIIRKQGAEAGAPITGKYDRKVLVESFEKELAASLESAIPGFEALISDENYNGALGVLGELRPVVDAFFDNVMVMCDDAHLRLNRLNLLKSLVDALAKLADFSALQV